MTSMRLLPSARVGASGAWAAILLLGCPLPGDGPTDVGAATHDAAPMADSGRSDGAAGDAAAAGPCLAVEDRAFEPNLSGAIVIVEGDHMSQGHTLPGPLARLQSGPPLPPYLETDREGECAIYEGEAAGNCQPACDGYCSQAGDCTPWPRPLSAGTITVAGLRGPLSFTPSSLGYLTDTQLGEQLFVPGSTVEARAAGAEVAAFVLRAVAPVAIDTSMTAIHLVDGSDFAVTWTPAQAALVRLLIEVGVHAAPGTVLVCESPDDGHILVPRRLIARFPYYQPGPMPISGYALLGNVARAMVQCDVGKIELSVASQKALDFTHVAP